SRSTPGPAAPPKRSIDRSATSLSASFPASRAARPHPSSRGQRSCTRNWSRGDAVGCSTRPASCASPFPLPPLFSLTAAANRYQLERSRSVLNSPFTHFTLSGDLQGRIVQIATVSAAVMPPATLPVTVASSSAEPSLKTLSVASETWLRFVTLDA